MNLSLLLEMVAEGAGDRVVVGSRDAGLSAGELLVRSRRLAEVLVSKKAEHLGLVDTNSNMVPIALFGAALAGIPFSPVNYRLAEEQFATLVGRLAPGVVVAGADALSRMPEVEGLDVVGTGRLLEEIDSPSDGTDLPSVDPEEVAVALFTSGTTGEPKAALLRHRHLASYIIGTVEYLGADPAEAQLVSVPPYHIAGISAVLSCVYAGRRIVYLANFDPDQWVRTIVDEQITQAMVVPTMLGRILSAVEENGHQLSCLRHLSYGGGRMPLDVIEQAMKVLPEVNFVNAYGLTETSSTVAILTPEDHREAIRSADPSVRGRLASVGKPLPTLEVEIRDPDGNVVGAGERGEIYVRGEQVAGEYQGRSVLTQEGWFPTNDAGWLDQAGYLYLDGRLDDVIVRGGENISPGEIEATIASHPAVADAAVVGVPDLEWGETVGAVVVLVPGAHASEEELKSWVRDRLRSARTPQIIQFREELPHNETGKLLRRVIKQELSESPN